MRRGIRDGAGCAVIRRWPPPPHTRTGGGGGREGVKVRRQSGAGVSPPSRPRERSGEES
jgi:hypothetical protein